MVKEAVQGPTKLGSGRTGAECGSRGSVVLGPHFRPPSLVSSSSCGMAPDPSTAGLGIQRGQDTRLPGGEGPMLSQEALLWLVS